MIGRTNAGGGRGKLDFRVMSGLSAPANPRRNDIWIKSDIPVTQVLVSTIDAWAEIRGAVNLRFATTVWNDGEKNLAFAGKVNGYAWQLWSVPTYCKISDGSKLVNVDAYIWRGQWVQFGYAFDGYLYNNGKFADSYGYSEITDKSTITKYPTEFVIQSTAGSWYPKAYICWENVAIKGYSKVSIDFSITSGTKQYFSAMLASTKDASLSNGQYIVSVTSSAASGTAVLDISNVPEGRYYILVGFEYNTYADYGRTVHVTSVKLE